MLKSATLALALGLQIILLTSNAYCQQQQQKQQAPIPAASSAPAAGAAPAAAPISVPSSLSANQATGSVATVNDGDKPKQVWPMVNVDGTANKSTVDVHVPVFFDMVNQADKDVGKSKLDLSVLQGLVTVNKDKTRDANGDMTGPLKVTVFGIPVYTGKAANANAVSNSPSVQARPANRASDSDDLTTTLTNKVQKVNEKMLTSLSDIFERFSSALRRSSSTSPAVQSPNTEQLKIERDRANPQRFQSQAAKLLDGSKEDRRSIFESRANK